MPKFLLIESSGDVCSAAVSEDGKIIASKSILEPNSHSTYLAGYIDDVLKKSCLRINDLDAVVIGGGPGSYTGLRIGCSLAKGICFASDLPLISCSNLKALSAAGFDKNQDINTLICLIDARRMDAYLGVFDRREGDVITEQFVTLDEQLGVDYFGEDIGAVGNGAKKWLQEFEVPDIKNLEIPTIYAGYLLQEAMEKWEAKDFENIVSFEPNYIKSVFVTKPKPKF